MFLFSVFVPRLKLGKKSSTNSLKGSPKASPRKHSSLRNSPRDQEPIVVPNRLDEIRKKIDYIPEGGFQVTVRDFGRGHGGYVYLKGKKIFPNNSNIGISEEKLNSVFEEIFEGNSIRNYIKQSANQYGFLTLSQRCTGAVITSRYPTWLLNCKASRHDFIINPDNSLTYIERFYVDSYNDCDNNAKISPRGKDSLDNVNTEDSGIDTSEKNRPLGIFVTRSVIKPDEAGLVKHVVEKDVCYVLDDRLINPDEEHQKLFDDKNVEIFVDRKDISFQNVEDELNNEILSEIYACELHKLKNACGELEEVSTPRARVGEVNPPAPNTLQMVGLHTVETVKKILDKEKVSIDEMGLVTEYVKSNTRVIEDPADFDKCKRLLNATVKVAHIDKPWGLTLGFAGLLVFSLAAAITAAALIPASGGLTGPLAFFGLMIAVKSTACLIASTSVTIAALLTTLGMGMLTFKSRTIVTGPLGESGRELIASRPTIN